MLSNGDVERLIAEKRHEIEREKIHLGLSPPPPVGACDDLQDIEDKENSIAINNGSPKSSKPKKSVRLEEPKVLSKHATNQEQKEAPEVAEIPAGLERYIRRYLGLPVMLKTGEYSPNNPLVRAAERAVGGDVLLGLGEYERRRNTLRKIQQRQYREYLDQQAKKKQEAKEQAEKERREREERETIRDEERERARQQLEQESIDRRASVCFVPTVASNNNSCLRNKVDTGVQVGTGRPLSVGVQTDDAELYRLSPSPTKFQITQAERELSPRTVVDHDDRPIQPATWTKGQWGKGGGDKDREKSARRRSYGDFVEHSSPPLQRPSRERLLSDLRHTYMPSIFDADAIQIRNKQAEKEAAERRQFYQQELKNQILEQQRIREERKTREKMLEQAEMRRLEEQLRMLRAAQETETGRHRDLDAAMKESSSDYDKKRTALQKEIDLEHQKLIRAKTQPKRTTTSQSDTNLRLPAFYTKEKRLPFSTNIPDNSIFNPNYDVDSYLRKNLNPRKENYPKFDTPISEICETNKNVIIEKALIHDCPKEKPRIEREKPKYEPSFLKNLDDIEHDTPIPVLRHSPVVSGTKVDDNLSDGMKLVDDKWKVPAVQKNILKSLPKEEGRNVSILTQLGSIRRQLQLEQLRLDNMMSKSD